MVGVRKPCMGGGVVLGTAEHAACWRVHHCGLSQNSKFGSAELWKAVLRTLFFSTGIRSLSLTPMCYEVLIWGLEMVSKW